MKIQAYNWIKDFVVAPKIDKIPDIKPGWTVRVHQKIQEKDKTRIQIFEGLVIKRNRNKEAGATFTIRKITNGVGVERTYPLFSPLIDKIEVIKKSKARRAKLYYLREKSARETRRKIKNLVVEFGKVERKQEAPQMLGIESKILERPEKALSQNQKN